MFNRCCFMLVIVLVLNCTGNADDKKLSVLSDKEIADGWIALFDGESTFGWTVEGEVKVQAGKLILGGTKATTLTQTSTFGPFAYNMEFEATLPNKDMPTLLFLDVNDKEPGYKIDSKFSRSRFANSPGTITKRNQLRLVVPEGNVLTIKLLNLLPRGSKPLFNGKDLSGWKVNNADPKRVLSKFDVTPTGELRVINGPGDLQTEEQFGDFCLQYECKTNGKNLNSGIFFRCMPDQYQNGYEAQIQNAYKDNDRTKPVDFGTGAIYRRVPARKVVSNDEEWFTMTVLANGPHISTWVNGYQVVDWLDDRKEDENPRKGLRTAAGHLSIQGHDPTTNIVFRNMRIVDLKK